jgi:flagellar hook-length control protein FliK
MVGRSPTGVRTAAVRQPTGDAAAGPDAALPPIAAAPPATTPTAAGTVAPAAPAPATPASRATTAGQIAAPVLPLRAAGDGIHRLTVHLHPADLGPVSVVAEIRGGDIHLHLAGATEAGREALRAALPELRRELQQAGFRDASLDVGLDLQQQPAQDQPARHQAGDQPDHRPAPANAASAPDREPGPDQTNRIQAPGNRPPRAPGLAHQLDLRI